MITDLTVKPGDEILAGQSIAVVSQVGLDLKILLARRKLEDLQAQDADITAREDQNNAAALKALTEENETRSKVINDLKQQEGSLADRLRNEQELQAKGLTTQSTVITARDSLFSVQHQISDNQVRLTEIISEKVKLARETQEKRNTRKRRSTIRSDNFTSMKPSGNGARKY